MTDVSLKDGTAALFTAALNLALDRRAAALSKSVAACTEDANTWAGILASVDGLETLVAATNTLLTTVNGNVDGLEALIGSTNALLTTQAGYLDGVEGKLDSLITIGGGTTPQNVVLDTGTISNGGTALTPKFAKIAASTSGDNSIVTAVASKKIRVLAYNFMFAGTANAKFVSDIAAGSPVDLTGLKYGIANAGISANFNPLGWFETVAGKALVLSLSAAIAVGGELVYIEV